MTTNNPKLKVTGWKHTAGSTPPTGISQNPGSITCLANQAGNATLATLTEIGGTGASVVFSVTGNANLTVSGSSLKTVANPSFTAGVNQTYTLHVTDTGGTFDGTARTITVPAGPSAIVATPSTLASDAPAGTLAANLTDTGGTAPFTWAIAAGPDNFNGYLTITSPGSTSTLTLNSSGAGNLTPGTPLTGKVTVTDAGGNSFTSGTITVAVNQTLTAPTGISTSPSSISIRSDQTGGATLATLSEFGGTGASVVYSVIGNSNLTVSGSNLNTVASPSFTAGVNQTYFLSVTDTGGTYTDSVARTLTVLAVPTGVTSNPASVTALANATANTVLATLAENSGTGSSVTFSVSGNTNLKIVGSNLEVNTSPSFTAGVNQTYSLGVSDSGGSYSDSNQRTLTVPAGPSAVTLTGNSVLDNATSGTLVSTIAVTGGTPPYTFVYTGGTNTNFNISPSSGTTSSLVVSNTGPGSVGTQSVNIQVTDSAGLTATSGSTTITVADHTASSLRTTIAIKNSGGSTQTTPFVTKMFGHAFKKGDMLIGGVNSYPIFKIGSTVVPYSIGAVRTWSDGSLKFAAFMLRIPTGNNIAAGGTLNVDVYNGGTAPAASSRSASDFSNGGHVYQVEFDGAAGTLSGTWIASLNDGFSNGIVNVWMDGDAGKVWKVEAQAKKNGVAHGQLSVLFYCAALQNAAGGLAGLRMDPRCVQKNVETTTPAKQMLVFSRVQLTDNGSLVFDPWASAPNSAAVTMTWAGNVGSTATVAAGGSGYVVGNKITLTNGLTYKVSAVGTGGAVTGVNSPTGLASSTVANPVPQASTTGTGTGCTLNVTYDIANFGVPAAGPGTGILAGTHKGGYCCLLTTTGTLPAGLSTGTPFFMHYTGTANQINLCTDSKKAAGPNTTGNGYIGSSNAGTGTHTLTPVPFLCWGSGIYVTPTTGLWNYIQASGTVAADDTCRIVPNNSYLRSTRMIPPYDLTLTGGVGAALQPYVINGSTVLLEQDMGNTGERGDIGPLNMWTAFYMVNQDTTSETNLRVLGHVDTHFASCIRSVSNGCLINCRTDPAHGTYTGIVQPPSNDGSQFRWDPGVTTTIPGAPLVNQQGTFTQIAEEHHTILSYPALLIFGEPQYYDQVMERANAMPLSRLAQPSDPALYNSFRGGTTGAEKNHNVLGVIYQGNVLGGTSSRADAWALRNMAWANAIASDTSYDGADYKTYTGDSLNNSFNMLLNWRTMYPPGYAVTNGVFGYLQNGRDSGWQAGYRRMATAIAVAACENSSAVSFMNLILKRPPQVVKIARDAGSPSPMFNITGYHAIVCLNTDANDAMPSDFVDSDAHTGNTIQTSLSASAGNQNITYTIVAAGAVGTTYVPNVGDWYIFDGANGTARSAPFALNTPYYVISVTPSTATSGTLKLSATSNGTAITPTTAMAAVEVEGTSLFNTAHSLANLLAPDSFFSIVGAWTNWAVALADTGVVIDSTFVTGVAEQLSYQFANFPAYASNTKANPKYMMSTSY